MTSVLRTGRAAPCASRTAKRSACVVRASAQDTPDAGAMRRRFAGACAGLVVASSLLGAAPAVARLEGVNKPELLPKTQGELLIDVAGFLTEGEEKRMVSELKAIEADTGVKLRVLAQNYPETPGLAIRDYWGVDDDTVVFVADPGLGNLLNFNVGQNVDLSVPRSFWTRLSSKYGVKKYWSTEGEGTAILNTVSAIDTCLREPEGPGKCSKVQGEFGEAPSSGKIGKALFGQ
ncbi:unnamed protein product [Pedinophyceae sp. YPF-701]|nr:unnamed protein product [Pedinophyceae sp. YPF-701]